MIHNSFTLHQRHIAALLAVLLVRLIFPCVGEVRALGDECPASEQQGNEEDDDDARPLAELSCSSSRLSPDHPAPQRPARLTLRRPSRAPLPLVCRYSQLQPVPFTVRLLI